MGRRLSIPKPLINLTDAETKTYKSICKHLKENSSLQDIDGMTICMAVKCWHRIEFIEELLYEKAGDEGFVQTYETGATAVTGLFTALQQESKRWEKFCRMFGLTIEAREKLISFKADANKEPGLMSKLRDIREKQRKVV